MQYWHCKLKSRLEFKNSGRLGLPLQIIACLCVIFIHGNFTLFSPQDEKTHWIHVDAMLCSIHIAQFAGPDLFSVHYTSSIVEASEYSSLLISILAFLWHCSVHWVLQEQDLIYFHNIFRLLIFD